MLDGEYVALCMCRRAGDRMKHFGRSQKVKSLQVDTSKCTIMIYFQLEPNRDGINFTNLGSEQVYSNSFDKFRLTNFDFRV